MTAKGKKKTIVAKSKKPVGKRRRNVQRTPKSPGRLAAFVLPLVFSLAIIFCLGVLGFLGYSNVTASTFFDVSSVEVRGNERSSTGEIAAIVKRQAERSGVWNADLLEIKRQVEQVTFVKTVSVSRVLPSGIRVFVNERVPQAVVRLNSGDYLVGEEGEVLAPASRPEEKLPFAMLGWDEAKSPKASKENLERVKMYQKMLSEWQTSNLASRVTSVNLADLREPVAITEDSGLPVSITLRRENFGEHLVNGIKAIVGKGEVFEGVDLIGANMILSPRKRAAETRQ